ncbi:YcaO-like family protein, partial [Streptomyces sp. NRRL WC-3742]|uniref:YcaO-like family protein n=1 Tax=Streptomyces sp. NRRL WC-3742 TaxID=1463934 RepID=UPI0018FE18B0
MTTTPTTAYDRIADTRPRLRRDVLFTETADGVLFHNARSGFTLTGPSAHHFATLTTPHLDGATTVADLTRDLRPAQRVMLVRLVRNLYERGLAQDAAPADAPEADAPIASPDHDADCFQHFRTTPVAVLGDDPLARSCALGLIRSGCADLAVTDGPGIAELIAEARELTEAGCPVTVTGLSAATEPGWPELERYPTVVAAGTTRIARLLAEGVPEGQTLLPAWDFGRSATIGPLAAPGADCCWGCAVNAPRASEPAPWTGPMAAMLGNRLGFDLPHHPVARTARPAVLTPLPDDHAAQSPLKVGTVAVDLGDGRRRLISAFDLHHTAAARQRALLRAAEVYAARAVPVTPAPSDAPWPTVAPARLSTGSDVPTEAVTAWAPAISLLDGRTHRVPVAALRPFGPYNREHLFEPTPAGLGAGSTHTEAVRRGLLTALAHDELRKALRHTTPVTRITPEEFTDDTELTALAHAAEHLGITPELLELGTPALRPAPVVLARHPDPLTGTWRWSA